MHDHPPEQVWDWQFRNWLLRPVLDRLDVLGELTMADQASIDALTQQVSDLKDKLTADDAAIQQEIANLQSQGVDTTALEAAVADLSSAVDQTGALVPPATS